MFDLCEVVITAPDADWLTSQMRHLVEAGLAARGTLVTVRAVYLSEGELNDKTEFQASLHTRRGNVTAIVDHIARGATAQATGVTALPITDGHPAYLQWVRTQTRTPRKAPGPRGQQEQSQ